MIAAGRRPKEGDRETGDGLPTLEPRGAIRYFPSTLFTTKAAVESAVGQVVSCSHVGDARLEIVVETHDLASDPLVAVDVERANGFDANRAAGASHQENNRLNQRNQI